jgi:hypothetical protein
MSRRSTLWLFALAAALVVAGPAPAKEKEKGPRELAAERKVHAVTGEPQLIRKQKLGQADARAAGVDEAIVAELPLVTVDLPAEPDLAPAPPRTLQRMARRLADPISGCWRATWRYGAGTWPYHRDIYQQTTWCTTIFNRIASYSGNAWLHSDVGCSPNYGPTYQRVGGGVGSTSVDIRTDGGFNCNIYWYGLQVWLWMVPRYFGWGGTALAGAGQ